MRSAHLTLLTVVLAGCSLVVPGNGGLTPDLVDGGPMQLPDGGPPPDAPMVPPDAGPQCEPGLTACGASCVDTSTDTANCGGCGMRCAPTDVCRESACYDPAVQVAAGPTHTCVRRASGQVWCWGANTFGQLGDGSVIDSASPVRVAGLEDAAGVEAGGFLWRTADGLSCALQRAGTVRCWGLVADGVTEANPNPVPIESLAPARQVAVGSSRACAITTTNRLYCWSGTAPAPAEVLPPDTFGSWAQDVDLSQQTVCAVTQLGGAFCWGANADGQLGDGTQTSSATPVRVAGINDALEIAASSNATCARTDSGTVSCWGVSLALGIGDSSVEPRLSPTTVPDLDEVSRLEGSAQGSTFCAIRGAERQLVCWGFDLSAAAETGMLTTRVATVPEPVTGLPGIIDVAVGGLHACVVVDGGRVFCWGLNTYGQVGDGTTAHRPTPVEVTLP